MAELLVNLNSGTDGARLHINELSVSNALKLFPAAEAVAITLFSAIVGVGAGAGATRHYRSQDDIPRLATVQEAWTFLDQNTDDTDLIDFEATIGDDISLKTHDDFMSTFAVPSMKQALELLDAVLGPDACPIYRTTVIGNPDKLVLLDNDTVTLFANYTEAWTARNRSPTISTALIPRDRDDRQQKCMHDE
jgi:hypothetical protein